MKTFFDLNPPIKILAETEHFVIIDDGYPVTPGHKLIISKEVYKDYFELPEVVRLDLDNGITKAKELVERTHSPTGYNIGMNCGADSGQTVFHFHCHLIPRYKGDVADPKGGVRHSVIGKGYY
jgi:diadenosine tetraphosphate (Ap4A) HIT family hydrolase